MHSDQDIKDYVDGKRFHLRALQGYEPFFVGCETPEAHAYHAERERKLAEARAAEEKARERVAMQRRIRRLRLPITVLDEERVLDGSYAGTPMLAAARTWWETKDSKPWLVLCGPVGRGKTFAAAAWLASFESGNAAYVGARELERLSMAKFGDDEEAFKRICDVYALVVDDVGREDDLGRMQTALLDLVDIRRRANTWTILATNFSRKAFCERYSDARLQSRLAECAQWFADVGEDMRRAKP